MADIIDLNLERPTGALLQRWRYRLSGEPTALIAEHILPALAEEIAASLVPASPSQVSKATMVLMGSFKIGADLLEDRPTFARAMKAELAKYPTTFSTKRSFASGVIPSFPSCRRSARWSRSVTNSCANVTSCSTGSIG
jgi:hypothetical protein